MPPIDDKNPDAAPGPEVQAPLTASEKPLEVSAADIAEAAGKIASEKLAEADRAKNPQPGPEVQEAIDAARKAPMSGSEAIRARGEPTVTMVFPRAVVLTLGDHSRIAFAQGTQEVPESLSSHQWLRLNGAKAYSK